VEFFSFIQMVVKRIYRLTQSAKKSLNIYLFFWIAR
jgi:hypothetical protein